MAQANIPPNPAGAIQQDQLDSQEADIDVGHDQDILEDDRVPQNIIENISDPTNESSPEVPMDNLEGFVEEAITSGTAVRWNRDGISGYVVPSEANEVGCRDYYFTDDDQPEWRSTTQRHCPTD